MLHLIGSNENIGDEYTYTLVSISTSENIEDEIDENYSYFEHIFESRVENFINDFIDNGKSKRLNQISSIGNIIEFLESILNLNVRQDWNTIHEELTEIKKLQSNENEKYKLPKVTRFTPSELLFKEQIIPKNTKFIYELYMTDYYAYYYET